MANITNYWRSAMIAVAFFAVAVVDIPFGVPVFAQGNGDRDTGGQGERGPGRGREGRRGGGPAGDRQRNDEGRRNRDNDNNDRPAEARPAATPPAAAATANSFGTVSESERIRKFATDTLTKHDANGNGILEGDELKKLGTSRDADKDGDGKITHNELVARYTPKTASTSTSTSQAVAKSAADSKPPAEAASKRLIVNKSRKSYRFKSTKDRIDNWKFSSKDANADGQVSMSEYSSAWSDRTATEFLRYDKDNDGMITVEEAK